MILAVGIVAAVVLVAIALTVWRKKGAAGRSKDQWSAKAMSKSKKKKKMSDTQAFRQWAHGDIDHEKYTEILDKNAKEGK
jgi:uncharacterized membrane protein